MKNNEFNIGIIGNGYVGNSLYQGLLNFYENIFVYDINPDKSFNFFNEVMVRSDIIFICLPTPTIEIDGKYVQSLEIIDNVLKKINTYNKSYTIIIKSTVIPGSTRKFSKKYPKNSFIFNPEFLTERTNLIDFYKQDQIILGYDYSKDSFAFDRISKVITLYKNIFKDSVNIKLTSFEIAELTKYFCNCFYAMKVTFANIFNELTEKMNLKEFEFEELIELAVGNNFIKNSHLKVPGPDGRYGYGGNCFPKDLKAMKHFLNEMNIDNSVFKSIDEYNDKIRNKKYKE